MPQMAKSLTANSKLNELHARPCRKKFPKIPPDKYSITRRFIGKVRNSTHLKLKALTANVRMIAVLMVSLLTKNVVSGCDCS